MNKAQILALADRVEALTEPCYMVEDAIEKAIGLQERFPPLAYTSSLDAAMSLDPGEPWLVSMMHETGHAGGWRVELSSLADGAVAISDAGCDAARAFTAASLRAMAGGEDEN